MEEKLIVKRNNEIEVLKRNLENLKKLRKEFSNHLCWSCQNGYPTKCPKVAMPEKASIEDYHFIKSGYQDYIYNPFLKNVILEAFAVSDCSLYEPTNEVNITKHYKENNRNELKLTKKLSK